ncbi:MAG: O-antigen ligase family protein, partial [Sulfuricurvum sp.]|nr:O-antigen ligase family protein [Sulfuricurvum sp.]
MNPSDRTFYYSALLFAFTLPLSRAAVSFFILWFVVLFLARKDFRTSWDMIKTSRALKAMGAFIAVMFASLLWSNDTHEALNQIRLYSYWIIIPILAVTLKKEWLPNIITAFLAGMFVSEIVAYGIYFEWWTYKKSTPEYPSPFMFHIHYSIFLATTSILLLSRLLSNRYMWQSKLPMFLFFLTSTGNLMLSTGRTGQLALLVAMGVAVIIHYRLTLKSFFIFVTLSTMLFVGAYTTLDLFQKRFDMAISDIRQFQEGNFDTSWGLRVAFWVVTYDIVREHPLIGIGIGDYKKAAAETLARNNHNFTPETIQWCSTSHYHNQYLMILA